MYVYKHIYIYIYIYIILLPIIQFIRQLIISRLSAAASLGCAPGLKLPTRHINVYVYMHTCVYIYVYREREREILIHV